MVFMVRSYSAGVIDGDGILRTKNRLSIQTALRTFQSIALQQDSHHARKRNATFSSLCLTFYHDPPSRRCQVHPRSTGTAALCASFLLSMTENRRTARLPGVFHPHPLLVRINCDKVVRIRQQRPVARLSDQSTTPQGFQPRRKPGNDAWVGGVADSSSGMHEPREPGRKLLLGLQCALGSKIPVIFRPFGQIDRPAAVLPEILHRVVLQGWGSPPLAITGIVDIVSAPLLECACRIRPLARELVEVIIHIQHIGDPHRIRAGSPFRGACPKIQSPVRVSRSYDSACIAPGNIRRSTDSEPGHGRT